MRRGELNEEISSVLLWINKKCLVCRNTRRMLSDDVLNMTGLPEGQRVHESCFEKMYKGDGEGGDEEDDDNVKKCLE